MDGRTSQVQLEFATIFRIMDLPDHRQDIHWFYTISIGVWTRSYSSHRVQNPFFETRCGTINQHHLERRTFLVSKQAWWNSSWYYLSKWGAQMTDESSIRQIRSTFLFQRRWSGLDLRLETRQIGRRKTGIYLAWALHRQLFLRERVLWVYILWRDTPGRASQWGLP